MPAVTLKTLRRLIYDRLENNGTWYSQVEVDDALNEGIAVTNVWTGLFQRTVTIYSIANRVIYDTPQEILMPIRIDYEGKTLTPIGLQNMGLAYKDWMKQTTRQQGVTVGEWIALGISKFAMRPVDSYGGRAITVTGVYEPAELVNESDVIQLPQESDIVDYAVHILQLPEGGTAFNQSMPIFESFLAGVKTVSLYKSLKSRAASATERTRN